MTVQSSNLVTDHSLMVSTPNLTPSTVYYYQVQSATASGASATSNALQFTTASLTVSIRVLDASNQPIAGAEVIIDGQSQTTSGNGTASFKQLPLGSQKVFIVSGNKVTEQKITVGGNNSKTGGYTLQKFNLVAASSKGGVGLYVILAIGIVIVAAVLFVPQSPLKLGRLLHAKDKALAFILSIEPNQDKEAPAAKTKKDDVVPSTAEDADSIEKASAAPAMTSGGNVNKDEVPTADPPAETSSDTNPDNPTESVRPPDFKL